MKKLAAVLALMLLCGCSDVGGGARSSPEKLLSSPFLMTADYLCGANEGSVSFKYLGYENSETEFLSPESVCGLRLAMNGPDATLSYMGIESARGASELKERNAALALHRFFTDMAAQLPEGEALKNGDVRYALPDGRSMTAYAGAIKTISLPALDMEFKATGFEKID